jgi:hypothetical protein
LISSDRCSLSEFPVTIRPPCYKNQGWEKDECKNGFPCVNDIRGDVFQNDDKPNVGKHAEDTRDEEDLKASKSDILAKGPNDFLGKSFLDDEMRIHIDQSDGPRFSIWYSHNADSTNNQKIEGSRSHDGSGSKISSFKSIAHDFNARE